MEIRYMVNVTSQNFISNIIRIILSVGKRNSKNKSELSAKIGQFGVKDN